MFISDSWFNRSSYSARGIDLDTENTFVQPLTPKDAPSSILSCFVTGLHSFLLLELPSHGRRPPLQSFPLSSRFRSSWTQGLITLIKCLKGHKSLQTLCDNPETPNLKLGRTFSVSDHWGKLVNDITLSAPFLENPCKISRVKDFVLEHQTLTT